MQNFNECVNKHYKIYLPLWILRNQNFSLSSTLAYKLKVHKPFDIYNNLLKTEYKVWFEKGYIVFRVSHWFIFIGEYDT